MIKHYKKRFSIVLTLALLLCSGMLLAQGKQPAYKNGNQQGVVKLKFSPTSEMSIRKLDAAAKRTANTGISTFDALTQKYEARNLKRLFPQNPNPQLEAKMVKHGLNLWYTLEVDENTDVMAVAKAFGGLKEIVVAETSKQKVLSPYTITPLTTSPATSSTGYFNDPYLPDQWHYDNTGQTGVEGVDINLSQAWSITAGSRDVIVSIHDEGVDIAHNDLAANIWVNEAEMNGTPGVDDDNNGYIDDIHGWNFSKDSPDIQPQGHGTHVAGTIAAVNNNAFGVSGVAGGTGNNDGALLMSLQIFNGALTENTYVYAANNGAVISQNSWGYTYPDVTEQAVQDAIDYFIAEAGDYANSPMKGGIVIFAAGNNNSDGKWYPGYYDNVIAVGATGPDGKKASYSNFGQWVDVMAPGGEFGFGSANGVLSTLPNNRVGYNQGTSMACPHVSGIAALALANRDHQLTPAELKVKLLTGVTDVYEQNPNYLGMLGSGNIDALLSIQNDQNIAPEAIIDLVVDGVAQDFANLSWTVPADQDDFQPAKFILYYHTEPLTAANLNQAKKVSLKNTETAGNTFSYQLEGLYGLTEYYFAVIAEDRWGHVSAVSNIVSETTNEGPSINVDANSANISMNIDMNTAATATHDIQILNEAEGILKWSYDSRHVSTSKSFNSAGISYPLVEANVSGRKPQVRRVPSAYRKADVQAPETSPSAFQPSSYRYTDYSSYVIGESDLTLPNSAATRFTVNLNEGFNMTHVRMYLKHKRANGPIVVEVRKGYDMATSQLLLAQEYTAWSDNEHEASITLNEQLFFAKGESFWVVFHVPAGTLYPLGIGPLTIPAQESSFLMSFDVGANWTQLSEILETNQVVWTTSAVSQNEYLGEYLSLDPDSGEVLGLEQQTAVLTANGSALINGTYKANLLLESNDGNNPQKRVPVTLTVKNQQPDLISVETLDFSSVFQGTEKELTFTVKNIGFGNFNSINLNITNPNFELVGWAPWQIQAKNETNITVRYKPSSVTGNDNGKLILSSSTQAEKLEVILFGVSTEPAQLTVSPMEQTFDGLTLGDPVNATLTVSNTGKSPMKYFVPGYDNSGTSDNWNTPYHAYGYKVRTSDAADSDPLAYQYQDISADGVNINATFRENDLAWYALDLGFDFPFYNERMSTLYVSYKGFASFTNEVRPINDPRLRDSYGPRGLIAPFGGFFDIAAIGNVYVKNEADRVIIQYQDMRPDSWSGTITYQMVLFANGNIRFYYDQVNLDPQWDQPYYNILIEDRPQTDGILIHNYDNRNPVSSQMAIGFDYPGPDIITSITNAGGILLPGESADMAITFDTSSLYEGSIDRYINVISNAPVDGQKIAKTTLNITQGGQAELIVSRNAIDFGTLFQGAASSFYFSIKNNGTAPVDITDMSLANGSFVIEGNLNATLAPGLAESYMVTIPTDMIASLTDTITITDSDGNTYQITLSGEIVDPPAIVVDLSSIDETLAYGEIAEHDFVIENPGAADLELVASGNEWLTMDVSMGTNAAFPQFTYAYEMNNDGSKYNWMDITETGTKLSMIEDDFLSPDQYFRELTLPWAFSFYGNEHNTLYIGEAGLITFERPAEVALFSDKIPTEQYDALIAPMWNYGGFIPELYPNENVGIYVKTNDNQIIISWEYLTNFAGIGNPMSCQVILNRNGSMIFQYKLQGSLDGMTRFSSVGLQNNDRSDFVMISSAKPLPLGDGLAVIITPAKRHIIAPGNSLTATIKLDAGSVYDGYYQGNLNIRTNVPGEEFLQKPVNLMVTGEPVLEPNRESVDFGEIMAFSGGSHTQELNIMNTGSAPVQLSGVALETANPDIKVEMYYYAPGWLPWLPGVWEWGDINFINSWPVVEPGKSAQLRITYTPTSGGEMTNNIVVNSSLTPVAVPVTAMVSLPPSLQVTTEEVYSVLNTTTATDTQTVEFNNIDGEGGLDYELSINYLRKGIATNSVAGSFGDIAEARPLSTIRSVAGATPAVLETYNRILSNDDKTAPDTYLGYQGYSPLTTGTRFNAGDQGFNLSHIETYMLATQATSGTISYEIRAGGNDITTAVSLASGSYNYDFASNVDGIVTIALDKEIVIYPNEDFYVIFNYPLELHHPQGTVKEVASVTGRYTLYDGVSWYDLQDSYSDFGWMVRAMEKTFVDNAWVVLESNTTGSVDQGASATVSLGFKGSKAQRGDQSAKLVIRTNDPENPVSEVPVTLHLNEAPYFASSVQSVEIAEGEKATQMFSILDKEDHAISYTLANAPQWVTSDFANGELNLHMEPGFEDAGNYTLTINAKDEYDAAVSMEVMIVVSPTNRAPEAIQAAALEYDELQVFDTRTFNDYFSDPDGDALVFDLSVADATIAGAYASGEEFVIQTQKEGTTALILGATDTSGARTEMQLNVMIDLVDYEFLKVFPNPATDHVNLQWGERWIGRVYVEIVALNGQVVQTATFDKVEDQRASQLSVSNLSRGLYLIRIKGQEQLSKTIKFVKN